MSRHVLSSLGRRTGPPPISWLMQLTLAHPHVISLAAGFTDSESLPVAETRKLFAEVWDKPRTARAALQYGSTAGDAELRRLTAERLRAQDAVKSRVPHPELYTAKRTIITNGSQQFLYLVTEALCDPGDIVLVEDPTYFVYLGIAQSHGLKCRGVRLEREGVDLADLARVLEQLKRSGDLKRVKMLYLVSYYQNPTGFTSSFVRKQAALELLRKYERAAGHPIYLLEDAAYRELRFAGEDVPSALTAKHAERVIYTSTYSKPFATGVRIGYGLLPEPLYTTVLRIKGNHDFGSANFLQQILAQALRSRRFDTHLEVIRKRYARKAAVMGKALREYFPETVRWDTPTGGLYYWAALPGRMKSGVKSQVFKTALNEDVLYVPGELCYANDATRPKPNNELRLSFGNASEAELRMGIERLGKVIERLRTK